MESRTLGMHWYGPAQEERLLKLQLSFTSDKLPVAKTPQNSPEPVCGDKGLTLVAWPEAHHL